MPKKNGPAPVARTSEGLRDALFDEIDRMRSDETTAKNANAVARLAYTIIQIVDMELQVERHVGQQVRSVGGEPRALPSFSLGNR